MTEFFAYPVETIMNVLNRAIDNRDEMFTLPHSDVVINITKTLTCFHKHGIKCACCGLEPSHFSVETDNRGKYLVLWAKTKDDTWTFMTRDHIIPRSKNGSDYYLNIQTMCYICNNTKGSQVADNVIKKYVTNHTASILMLKYPFLRRKIKNIYKHYKDYHSIDDDDIKSISRTFFKRTGKILKVDSFPCFGIITEV